MALALTTEIAAACEDSAAIETDDAVTIGTDDSHVKIDQIVVVGGGAAVDTVRIVAGRTRGRLLQDMEFVLPEAAILENWTEPQK